MSEIWQVYCTNRTGSIIIHRRIRNRNYSAEMYKVNLQYSWMRSSDEVSMRHMYGTAQKKHRSRITRESWQDCLWQIFMCRLISYGRLIHHQANHHLSPIIHIDDCHAAARWRLLSTIFPTNRSSPLTETNTYTSFPHIFSSDWHSAHNNSECACCSDALDRTAL